MLLLNRIECMYDIWEAHVCYPGPERSTVAHQGPSITVAFSREPAVLLPDRPFSTSTTR
jgi:hypothetical protein